jgi:transposase
MAVATECRNCERLKAQLAQLAARVAELEAQLAKATKNSSNSSKPPSSDIVKPPPKGVGGKRGKKKRKRGGQLGHPRHDRPAFPPEQIDATWEYFFHSCPDCGGGLVDSKEPARIIQQVEIIAKPVRIEEHRGVAQWCESCQKFHYAPLPDELVKGGLVGPRLTALVAYLKGACHASFSTIRKFLRDVVGVTISRGQLAKLVQKVSASLKQPYDELLGIVSSEARLNVDETGHPDQGQRLWTWCFRARLYTLFRVDPSRGSDVLVKVLGEEFNGLLGCDYFSAYRKYMRQFGVTVQFCLAHLIRDVKFLVKHPDAANRRYGETLLGYLRKLFKVIHRREQYASEESFRRTLASVRNDLVGAAILELPNTREAGNLADRFVNHYDAYFEFITTPDVEPTNNLAEQAIRFVAIHRRITQGTRGEAGQRWCERVWTAIVTCGQQGRSVFEFIYAAVLAHIHRTCPPTLLPNTS